jgi:hypothetical protein
MQETVQVHDNSPCTPGSNGIPGSYWQDELPERLNPQYPSIFSRSPGNQFPFLFTDLIGVLPFGKTHKFPN